MPLRDGYDNRPKAGFVTPLSSDPEKAAIQKANLRRGGPVQPGNAHRRSHGGYAAVAAEQMEAKAREVYESLADDAPLRDSAGELPAADTMVVRLLAECLCRLESVGSDVRDHGWKDRKTGEPRPVVELESRLRAEALALARELGMTPAARAKLGLDLVRLGPPAEDNRAIVTDPEVRAAARELVERAARARDRHLHSNERVSGSRRTTRDRF